MNLFPIPVFLKTLERKLKSEELDFIKASQLQESYHNLFGTKTDILDETILFGLKRDLCVHLNEYVRTTIDPKSELEFYITESWVNVTLPGQYHHRHKHSNSILSGVFYVDVLDDIDAITFCKNDYRQIDIKPKNTNIWNTKEWTIKIRTGDLIIFPSSLEHGVTTLDGNHNRKPRVSIAFNTFIKGKICDTQTCSLSI